MLSISDVMQFCTMLEQILRPLGLHVALTGSFLYGMGTGKDVDIIVYAHDHQPGAATAASLFGDAAKALTVLVTNLTKLTQSRSDYLPANTPRSSRVVWSGIYRDMRFDFLVLTEDDV